MEEDSNGASMVTSAQCIVKRPFMEGPFLFGPCPGESPGPEQDTNIKKPSEIELYSDVYRQNLGPGPNVPEIFGLYFIPVCHNTVGAPIDLCLGVHHVCTLLVFEAETYHLVFEFKFFVTRTKPF